MSRRDHSGVEHRPTPLPNRPAGDAIRITHSKYRTVRCDCGRPAVVSVGITLFSSSGRLLHGRLNLCPSCYELFRGMEADQTDADAPSP